MRSGSHRRNRPRALEHRYSTRVPSDCTVLVLQELTWYGLFGSEAYTLALCPLCLFTRAFTILICFPPHWADERSNQLLHLFSIVILKLTRWAMSASRTLQPRRAYASRTSSQLLQHPDGGGFPPKQGPPATSAISRQLPTFTIHGLQRSPVHLSASPSLLETFTLRVAAADAIAA